MADDHRVKLNSGASLGAFMRSLFDEGIKSSLAQKALTEKEKQAQLSGGDSSNGDDDDVDDLFGDGSDGGSDDAGDGDTSGGSSKTMDDETEKLQKGDEIKTKDIVERLNSIRGGKSFKEDNVAKAMDEYVSSLSKTEKVALLAFLKGISQIVTGEVSGDQAEDPGKHPADVEMEKTNDQETKHIRPNVIKGGKKPGASGGTRSAEDSTSPAPITPRKR